MHDTYREPVFKEKLNYIFTLWFHIIEKDHSASMNEVFSDDDMGMKNREHVALEAGVIGLQSMNDDTSVFETIIEYESEEVEKFYKTAYDDMKSKMENISKKFMNRNLIGTDWESSIDYL